MKAKAQDKEAWRRTDRQEDQGRKEAGPACKHRPRTSRQPLCEM
jgi:hypothetical protein